MRHASLAYGSFIMGGTKQSPGEEEQVMTSESGKRELFAGLPRRNRIGGVVTAALALILCGAFLTDAVPTRSSEDWLYDLEARRDVLARAYQARAHPAQRAGWSAPAEPARATALASIVAPAVDHRPASAPAKHARCAGMVSSNR